MSTCELKLKRIKQQTTLEFERIQATDRGELRERKQYVLVKLILNAIHSETHQ